MLNNLRNVAIFILFLGNYQIQIQASDATLPPATHNPEASFRIGVTKGPSNTITANITPANSGTGLDNNNTNDVIELASQQTISTNNLTNTPQIIKVPAPAYMGALIVMGSNNDIKNHYIDVALVVLIPYNADQLTTVDKFIKWIYEQQAVNLSKLKNDINTQSRHLKIYNVKSSLIYQTDLQPYMTNTKSSFKDAVTKFAEILGGYEKAMSKLQFNDLKSAVLNNMKSIVNK